MEFSLENLCVGIGAYRVKKLPLSHQTFMPYEKFLKKRNDSQGKIILLSLDSPNF